MRIVLLMLLVVLPRLSEARYLTAPIGFKTITIPGNSLSLVGLPPAEYPVVSSESGSVTHNSLIDETHNFDDILIDGKSYVLEIESGPDRGTVIEIGSHSGAYLQLEKNLTRSVDVNYSIRPLKRLSEVCNPSLLRATDDLNPENADLVMIPSGDGIFEYYFVSTHPIHNRSFVSSKSGLKHDPVVSYIRPIYFFRRDAEDLILEISTGVKSSPTILQIREGYNYFSRIYPTGSTLANSNLKEALQWGSESTADIVWIQEHNGTSVEFNKYYFSDGSEPGISRGWRKKGGITPNAEQSQITLSEGFIIQRRNSQTSAALFTPPDFYLAL